MRATLTIAKREFSAYFKSPIAYIVLSVYVALSGLLFFNGLFLQGEADLQGLFGTMPIIFLFFGPAIAMRLLAEERGTGTIELLLTMPVRDVEVVLGKFLSGLALLVIGILLTTPFAYTVAKLGPLDKGPVVGGYLGAVLLGGTYLSIGLLASATTKNQIVAFIVGLAICFGLFLVGQFVPAAGKLGAVLQYATPQFHFTSISRGVIELRNVVYYASVIAALLTLTVLVLGARRWK